MYQFVDNVIIIILIIINYYLLHWKQSGQTNRQKFIFIYTYIDLIYLIFSIYRKRSEIFENLQIGRRKEEVESQCNK